MRTQFVRGGDPKTSLNIGSISRLFKSTTNAYSFNYYGDDNWKDIIKWFISNGYTEEETEMVLRSKIMRWAADNAGKMDSNCTLNDFLHYINTAQGYKNRGKDIISDFLDIHIPDSDRGKRIKPWRNSSIREEAMGGVSAPMATLNNTPGMGNASPPASADGASIGSGDKWGSGKLYTQNGKKKKRKVSIKRKKTNESNINPHDKIGVMMAKRLKVPLAFRKGKGGKDVEQIPIGENVSTKIVSFNEWASNKIKSDHIMKYSNDINESPYSSGGINIGGVSFSKFKIGDVVVYSSPLGILGDNNKVIPWDVIELISKKYSK